MDADGGNPDWQRGVLTTCALAVLARGSAHGYAVAQQLQSAGIGPVKGGALYPVLNRLEQDGVLTSAWQEGAGGPGRKVFTLTGAGHARLEALRRGWQPFAAAVADLLAPDTSPAAAAAGGRRADGSTP
ncbi:PadR family transcriptional regulator [Paenibacillus sp. TRM 82003]|uniref:PadR family transcriptional regulator n=1 Tax=Kineococcus sp. TRM81007 TaxID=2925831 RepID=UPI001F57D457|nr:PadR family transcriptional regulator [Kineococcus sp. TRM81007]MCI2238468.1 PadR family transcriptional regulator [Kineococcus sp. TRM81007]MCI3922018.1 PadR family transcriptional regulator [Paenibacillus sp. TRM 82003]